MQVIGILLALAVVVMGVQSWHEENGTFKDTPNLVYDALAPSTTRASQQPAKAPAVIASKKAVTEDELVLAHADASRVAATAKTYGVPEGALFGIWMMESRGLREAWGDSDRWILARDLSRSDSKCSANYDAERCADRWQIIRSLCAQKRHGKSDGQILCDPNEVRTTFGMAMGMTQHMPNVVLRPHPTGDYAWAPWAVDADKDGFRNPFDLDDALAWTALKILAHHGRAVAKEKPDPWRQAVIRYSGAGNDSYYDGMVKDGKRIAGAVDYWKLWQQCRKQGDCPAMIARLRAR